LTKRAVADAALPTVRLVGREGGGGRGGGGGGGGAGEAGRAPRRPSRRGVGAACRAISRG
ncbi:hypothetical protein, partial [Burkholderia pseudomallei]|uniref:hypothetical protein n=1 Tax=Burkholderia pseudomallei TaxID=28450 RepID=UPI0015C39103